MTNVLYGLYGRMTATLLSLRDREEGQSMVEYALILVLVALVAAAAFTALEGRLSGALDKIKF